VQEFFYLRESPRRELTRIGFESANSGVRQVAHAFASIANIAGITSLLLPKNAPNRVLESSSDVIHTESVLVRLCRVCCSEKDLTMNVEIVGAICFGIIIGWITYRTLRRTGETVAISNIASVIAAVGGGAVTALYKTPDLFSWYSIGLFIGFFGYLILGSTVFAKNSWLGSGD
jgi:hypothetical protein